MFRKRDGSYGFSFTRFIENAAPVIMPDLRPQDQNNMPQICRDKLHSHQLASPSFTALDANSIYVAEVVSDSRLSKSVFKALQKPQILDGEGHLDTRNIGPNFTHQLAILNARRQRDLINMLFWFEEECQRYNKLVTEDRELTDLIEAAKKSSVRQNDEDDDPDTTDQKEMLDQLKFARERVRMKIRQRPSQRQEDIEADRDDIVGAGFRRGRNDSAPGDLMTVTSGTGGDQSPNVRRESSGLNEVLPDYSTVARRRSR